VENLRILLVDDHKAVRGLRHLLGQRTDGSFAEKRVMAMKPSIVPSLHPDVIVMEVMPRRKASEGGDIVQNTPDPIASLPCMNIRVPPPEPSCGRWVVGRQGRPTAYSRCQSAIDHHRSFLPLVKRFDTPPPPY
jgi:hypothetical protein